MDLEFHILGAPTRKARASNERFVAEQKVSDWQMNTSFKENYLVHT